MITLKSYQERVLDSLRDFFIQCANDGRPEAAFFVERLVDYIALETGMAPDKLRAKNFIKPKQYPYKTPVGRVYDSGEFEKTMDMALKLADVAGFDSRKKDSRKNGKLRG